MHHTVCTNKAIVNCRSIYYILYSSLIIVPSSPFLFRRLLWSGFLLASCMTSSKIFQVCFPSRRDTGGGQAVPGAIQWGKREKELWCNCCRLLTQGVGLALNWTKAKQTNWAKGDLIRLTYFEIIIIFLAFGKGGGVGEPHEDHVFYFIY